MKKHRSWSVYEQASFLKRIAELLTRGYPLAEAIESLAFQLPLFRKEELFTCIFELKKGFPLHYVLTELGFNKDLTGYVFFSEQHGNFAEALLAGSELTIKREKDRQKLMKLLNYPIILLFITGGMFVFIEKSLLPKFTSLFKTMNLEANFFTKVIYAFAHYVPIFFTFLLISFTVAGLYYFLSFRKKPVLEQKRLLVRIPVAGRVLRLIHTQYFSIQLSFLLAGGLSITEALRLFERNKSQPFYCELGRMIKDKLLTGEKFERILQDFSFFDDDFAKIAKHGQENGKLEQELFFYSQHCINRLEEMLDKGFKVIQPVLYMFIGFLVISMYLSILLPMFHLMDGI
ncbi:MAG: competence type IV pilus assembly protein ComGB [Bacillota bacterium]|nr:competence type IV pilus assembly protein ComGB [Bacillota bacterium]